MFLFSVMVLNSLFIFVFDSSFCMVLVVGRNCIGLDGLSVISSLFILVFNRKCVWFVQLSSFNLVFCFVWVIFEKLMCVVMFCRLGSQNGLLCVCCWQWYMSVLLVWCVWQYLVVGKLQLISSSRLCLSVVLVLWMKFLVVLCDLVMRLFVLGRVVSLVGIFDGLMSWFFYCRLLLVLSIMLCWCYMLVCCVYSDMGIVLSILLLIIMLVNGVGNVLCYCVRAFGLGLSVFRCFCWCW